MPQFSNLQVPPPKNWQDFETICWDLWRKIWHDPTAQKNGRQGQHQHGVDIYGRPDKGKLWAGVQCKGKDNYTNQKVTEEELREEVEKALKFDSPLSEFTIATTAPRDSNIQKLARLITDDHLDRGLFSVTVFFWEDIKDRLEDFRDVLEKYYPGLFINTEALKKEFMEIKEPIEDILKNQAHITGSLISLKDDIKSSHHYNVFEITSGVTAEYNAELDYARELLKDNFPKRALTFLTKLKDRIWSQAPSNVRFRILTNIGAANLMLNNNHDAANLFIEALQYNPDDEKALSNTAIAYQILNNSDEAIRYANKVIEKNPANCQAYSVIVQASESEDFEIIIEKVPECYRNSTEISYAIGLIAIKKNLVTEAKNWLEIALKNNGTDTFDIKGTLGTVLLEKILNAQFSTHYAGLNKKAKKDVLRGIELLTEAWELVFNTDLRNSRISWIVNRAAGRKLLSQWQDGIKDINIALDIEPTNPSLIKYKAIFSANLNDNQTAIDLLNDILWNDKTPEAAIILADIFRIEKRYSEALSILIELLQRNSDTKLTEDAKRLLIQTYIESKTPDSLEEAKRISNSMRAENPTSIPNLVDAATVSRSFGEKSDAISLLIEASKYISEDTKIIDLNALADEFYLLEQFEEASKLYEKFANKEIDTPLTRRLINSYYFAGDRGKALEICNLLRSIYGPLKYITEMETAIYEEIDNLPEAKTICEDYLKSFPDDFEMKLRLAILNFRSEDYNGVDTFLKGPFDINKLSLHSAHQLANLFSERKNNKEALEIMYETRRQFYNKSEAHSKYIGYFFFAERNGEQLTNIIKVAMDTAVCVETDSGTKEWYILDNREDADMQRKEINIKHSLARRLLGRAIGEEVILKESPISVEVGKVIEIKSKYVYALHESLENFEKLFPDAQGLWKVKVDLTKKEESLKTILDQVSMQQDLVRQIEQLYKGHNITIGAFAELLGKNIIEVVGALMGNTEIGIKCCDGSKDEREHAINLLHSKPRIIIDIISLLTIYCLNCSNIIIKQFGKLGIAQSTIDLIKSIVDEREGVHAGGLLTIGKQGDQFIRQEISAEDMKRSAEYFKDILGWIDGNCDILPVRPALKINKNTRDDFNKTLGASFVDTILIASESGNLIYSDDAYLRAVAKNDFNVEGIWTQPLLMQSVKQDILEREKYNEIIVKLICSNYHYISIDEHIIIEAAKQAKWVPLYPYTKVIKILNGSSSDEFSAINIVANCIYDFWKQPILPFNRDNLIDSLLNELTISRNRMKTIEKLKKILKVKLQLLPIIELNVNQLISLWGKINII